MEENYNWIKARIIVNKKPILVRQEWEGSGFFIAKDTGVRFPVEQLDFASFADEESDMKEKEMEILKAHITKREFWREFRCKVYLHLIDKSDGMINPKEISNVADAIFKHAITQDSDFFSVVDSVFLENYSDK